MFLFSPLFGEESHFDYFFSKGLVQPATSGAWILILLRKFGFWGKEPPNLDLFVFSNAGDKVAREHKLLYVGVSKNSVTPFSNRVFHYKPSILGYPYFWKYACSWVFRILSTRVLSGSRNFPSHRQGRDRSRWKPLESPKIAGTTLSRSQQLGKSGAASPAKKKRNMNGTRASEQKQRQWTSKSLQRWVFEPFTKEGSRKLPLFCCLFMSDTMKSGAIICENRSKDLSVTGDCSWKKRTLRKNDMFVFLGDCSSKKPWRFFPDPPPKKKNSPFCRVCNKHVP